MAKDPYAVLGLHRNVSAADITSAYRSLAKKYHPDLNPRNKGAHEKFKELNAARTALSGKERHAGYVSPPAGARDSPRLDITV